MHTRQSGFSLLEAIVALLLVALVFTALHQGMAAGWRGIGAGDREQAALALARQILAETGVTSPLAAGRSFGPETDGVSWRVETERIDPAGDQAAAGIATYRVRVDVRWRDWRGVRQVSLETVKLGAPADGS